jgi:hypothetical protein
VASPTHLQLLVSDCAARRKRRTETTSCTAALERCVVVVTEPRAALAVRALPLWSKLLAVVGCRTVVHRNPRVAPWVHGAGTNLIKAMARASHSAFDQ